MRVWGIGHERAAPSALEVHVARPSSDSEFGSGIIDWWPVDAIESRRASMEKLGLLGIRWNTRVGEAHTATMLVNSQSAEESAAVWIGAYLWGLDHSRRGQWTLPEDTELSIRHAVYGELRRRGHALWHASSREVLPERLAHTEDGNLFPPRNVRDVIEFARLQSLVVRGLWTLVRVIRDVTL
jgi:hypothetical protein